MRTPAHWQHRGALSLLLQPLAWLYGLGAWHDRRTTTPERAALPVIAVGNVVAGGAGKTPTAMALAALLHRMGHRPHLITRGYGSSGQGTRRAEGDWQQVGDEALLLATVAPTWVGRDRLASTRAAQQAGATLVVADDALQHHRLAKDITFLVIEGAYGIGNGQLLPAGPLREPLAEAEARSDAVIMIGANTQQLTFQRPVFAAELVPVGDPSWLRGARVLAFAGLARPEKFYTTLRRLGATLVAAQDFPDHHAYTSRELEALCEAADKAGAIPVATAKDAVKFPEPYRTRIRVLEVALRFTDETALTGWLQSRLSPPI